MKRVFLVMVVSAMLATLGFAQTPDASANTAPADVKGCLGGSEGNYTVVEDGTGQLFKITSSSVDLKAHLGHDVKLTGQKASGAANSLTASEVSMISEHCAAAAAAAVPAAVEPSPQTSIPPDPPAAAPAPASPPAPDAATAPATPPAATASAPVVDPAAPAATVTPTPAVAPAPAAAPAPAPAPITTPAVETAAPAATVSPSAPAVTSHVVEEAAPPRDRQRTRTNSPPSRLQPIKLLILHPLRPSARPRTPPHLRLRMPQHRCGCGSVHANRQPSGCSRSCTCPGHSQDRLSGALDLICRAGHRLRHDGPADRKVEKTENAGTGRRSKSVFYQRSWHA